MLTIDRVTEGHRCDICCTDKNVVAATLNKGLSGHFCWKCTWKMLEARQKHGADEHGDDGHEEE